MRPVVHNLQAARELIRKGWCRGKFTKNIRGEEKVCAVGALHKVFGQHYGLLHEEAGKYLNIAVGSPDADTLRPVVLFNDAKKNKRDVIKLYDKAIQLAMRDES